MGIPHPRVHLKVFISSLVFTVFTLVLVRLTKKPTPVSPYPKIHRLPTPMNFSAPAIPSKEELRKIWIQKKIDRLSSKFNIESNALEKPKYEPMLKVNPRAHIFYYAWYRNVEMDRVARHWNDDVSQEDDRFGLGKTDTLMGVRVSFYPQEGFYSSKNLTILHMHMEHLKTCGIGVAIIYWKPPGFEDSPEEALSDIMDIASKYGIKVAFHLAPFYNWSVANLIAHLKTIIETYGNTDTLYKMTWKGKTLPVFYIYDPFDLESSVWAQFLSPDGSSSIRNTKYDSFFIGLLADVKHRIEIKKSQFDGFYTYFAGNGYTYGSSWKNWQSLAKFARDSDLIFVPCVAPGYAEPGGGSTNRPRHKGNYFEVGMRAALDTNPDVVAITSYNAWEEGSQIEPAIPQRTGSYVYLDYKPQDPNYYLDLAGWWIKTWTEKQNMTTN